MDGTSGKVQEVAGLKENVETQTQSAVIQNMSA